ncbi:NADH:flavin oxidoreductase/NADH oxidase [Colletotrichum paranaense]|uniref:NADH:flavin oxidoreductase/NADH oxidase n=3 Tax=Colletotrichum acutatum species complex TaxID=2707335 RepID=A0AAI9YKV1_9PEZI|nr:NADH:flavin oxidoreductase/NADH oxidase [Colletotrichum costaricense]XP_060354720.1 NADH:flavin oxidoreductase/NADH oxidase [Colletotrichum paranaense]XP_060389217.1 NADH:flavin oxidoreductase/NADH oxidase [Colletotrichum tamarilloi]KAK1513144.1 NADH:flavin oxidoreductase/NADH oxidase [Colletotrichum tamarilloi]KAK1514604.1 NADH:flavin oxidoreductase/NADH oxidase [Colletotrichum costaricense]KAK1545603.1 NADH:flavin oxidoreductase/NADH oxidase [Colletotrichum paranaense]
MTGTANKAAPGVPFYTPAQEPPAGTPVDAPAAPTLFQPLQIRDLTLNNRIWVSPMCQYSADNGHMTDYHLVHLGQFALHGAALTIIEATGVEARGRISPEDVGLWQDSQVAPLKRVVDFIHSQNQAVGIQLAHAGRKASTLAPWITETKGKALALESEGGWPDDCVAPSSIPFTEGWATPRELTLEEIQGVVKAFAESAKRAVEAGVDVIEIHGAHGYLITQFLSPLTNQRTDKYGGSFENRTRILFEVIKAVRDVIPSGMPLFLRISATEWMEYDGKPSWVVEDSIKLAKLLPEAGVDLLDVSSGGNNEAQKIEISPYYQVSIAGKIREALAAEGKKLFIGAVGMISSGEMARSIVQARGSGSAEANGHNGVDQGNAATLEVDEEHGQVTQADAVFVARQFLREPNFVYKIADEIGVRIKWANQYHRAPRRKH